MTLNGIFYIAIYFAEYVTRPNVHVSQTVTSCMYDGVNIMPVQIV